MDPDDEFYQPEQMREWFERTGGEFHPNGFNYCGPRTLFALRNMGKDGKYYKFVMERAGLKPVGTEPYNTPANEIDSAAFEHDRVFSDINATTEEVRLADLEFVERVKSIGFSSDLARYIKAQLASDVIGLKMMAENVGLVRRGLFSAAAQRDFTRAVYGRNESLADDIDLISFWGWVVDTYFRGLNWLREEASEAGLTTGLSVGITLVSRLAQRRRIPGVGTAIDKLINFIAGRLSQNVAPDELIRGAESILESISDQVIQSWFDDWGNAGELAQLGVRYGVRELIMAMIDKLPNWITVSMKSEDWVSREAVTEADIEEILQRREDPGRRQNVDITVQEATVFRDAMRDIENQTPGEKLRNVLAILRTIRDVNPTFTSKLSGISKALADGKVLQKIRILKGTVTMQVLRSILRERIPPTIVQTLINLFPDEFKLNTGESISRLRIRLQGMTYIGLISQYAMLREFADFFK